MQAVGRLAQGPSFESFETVRRRTATLRHASAAALVILLLARATVPDFMAAVRLYWHAPTTQPAEAHVLATRERFTSIPYRRHVDFVSNPSQVDAAQGIPAGFYDTGSRSITIVRHGNSLVDAALFTRELRHEYGHAFIHDYCRSRYGPDVGDVYMSKIQDTDADGPPRAKMNPELEPLYAEYVLDPGFFGPYPSTSFGEWLAEAYTAFVEERRLPGDTRHFIEHAAEMDEDARRCDDCH